MFSIRVTIASYFTYELDGMKNYMDLSSKRFLITHTQIHTIMGSTMVVLDLARFLKSQGAVVEIFTSWCDGPAGEEFKQEGIPVYTDEEKHFVITDYDYIWINSQVFPISLISQLLNTNICDMPFFIFNHMSPLKWAPDEQPYMYTFEERISSISLFVSQETKDALEKFYESPRFPTAVFPNPTGEEYCNAGKPSDSANKIAIVSNHLPSEVAQAAAILKCNGLTVDHYGLGGILKIIGPDDISKYDAIISIGKTVQYCLLAGIPIFVYDHFGGFGYLSDEKYSAAEYSNFSGRGGDHLSPDEIACRVLNDYPEALAWANKNIERFKKRFLISRSLPIVLDKARKQSFGPLSTAFLSSLEASQRFSFRYYVRWVEHERSEQESQQLAFRANQLNKALKGARLELAQTQAKLDEVTGELNGLRTSETYFIGKIIAFPFRQVKLIITQFISRIKLLVSK